MWALQSILVLKEEEDHPLWKQTYIVKYFAYRVFFMGSSSSPTTKCCGKHGHPSNARSTCGSLPTNVCGPSTVIISMVLSTMSHVPSTLVPLRLPNTCSSVAPRQQSSNRCSPLWCHSCPPNQGPTFPVPTSGLVVEQPLHLWCARISSQHCCSQDNLEGTQRLGHQRSTIYRDNDTMMKLGFGLRLQQRGWQIS